mmetsp:Transcript_17987/g.44435  ORF Transcript_17987/g.44435 Transcript_17987/m.44435 type:complete len:128 (+) Transcript_17987:462-845(+)
MFGIIKETGVDDAGLEDFYKDYFPFPLYKDETLKFYEALGNGSVTDHIMYNPFKAIAALRRHNNRHKEKKIEGNLKGEGIRSGGLIIFGKDGSPQFMVPEQTGTLFDEDELFAALESVRKGGKDGEL